MVAQESGGISEEAQMDPALEKSSGGIDGDGRIHIDLRHGIAGNYT